MSEVLPIGLLAQDLKTWESVIVSEMPEIPRNETKYKIKGHHLFETIHGHTLILDLYNHKEDKDISISFPDIEEVRLNDLSNQHQHKYYLECKVRLLDYKLKDKKGETSIGFNKDEFDDTTLMKNSYMKYRLILVN
ncbi:hypothetical protein [Halobacillus litoralis]|uniref:Uncharacterized protein n=1 Tax=Halobacillus litoralis TaxID=45668 RepID=A0A410MCJ5_9BACI|nr:hypothetical protein [Halobacillus litoralis]QAS52398.1 hypothetical protein HLI_09205 [Halobacillus litoralis]